MARSKKASSKKRSRSRRKKGLTVDFTDVESGGGKPVPDGEYTAKLHAVEEKEGESSGEPYLSCRWKIQGGKSDGATVFDNISLQPQSLWRFRTILECLGYDVEDGEMTIDMEDLIGEESGIEITNEDWEGKDKPRITGFLSSVVEDEDEEEEDEEEEEIEEDEEEEEIEEDEEEEEDEPPAKKKRKSRAKKPKKIRVGSKVKFDDEEGDTVKGVITELDDDTAQIEDSAGDVWEVDLSELTAV